MSKYSSSNVAAIPRSLSEKNLSFNGLFLRLFPRLSANPRLVGRLRIRSKMVFDACFGERLVPVDFLLGRGGLALLLRCQCNRGRPARS